MLCKHKSAPLLLCGTLLPLIQIRFHVKVTLSKSAGFTKIAGTLQQPHSKIIFTELNNLNLNTVSSSVDNPTRTWNHVDDESNYSSRIIKEQVK